MKKLLVVSMFLTAFVVLSFGIAMASEGAAGGLETPVKQMAALAAGLAIGIAAFGGAIGQGLASASALNGISRNPGAAGKILTPMILGLALIESLVIYAFVISILLYVKL
jgi:F-type H+-transporting ATPase subunit c